MKKLFRWPTWLILAAIVMAALVPTLPYFHGGKETAAHAVGNTGTPTITLSTSIAHPKEKIKVSGQGFGAHDGLGVFLDSTSGNDFAYILCDSTGNVSSTISLPYSSVPQGQHTIIVLDFTSGLSASAPIMFIPSVYKSAGRAGFPVLLNGASFAANEQVQVYWGNTTGTLEGTSVTDISGNFNFSFNLASGLLDGSYLISIVRTQQKPAIVTTYLTIYPVTMTSTPGIHSGQVVNVHFTGFLPGELVTLSWNANGGQQLSSLGTDTKGSGKIQFFPPSAPPGAYILTALGNTSGQQISNSLNVGPGISGWPSNPGNTTTVTGGGFSAGETVNVYFQTLANGIVSVTTDTTGAFTVSLTLPTTYNPADNYYIYAANTAGTEHTRAKFTFFKPILTPSYNNTYYNLSMAFYGSNFASNEKVSIIWNYQSAGQFIVGTVAADSSGGFVLTLPTPSTPNQSNVTIAAVGTSSNLTVTATIADYAMISLSPSTGTAGAKVQVNGGSFGSNENITITFQGTTIASTTTDAEGIFSATFKVPVIKGPGNVNVQASGAITGISVTVPFNYTPVIQATPNVVNSGDLFTVTGKHFTANSGVMIDWNTPDQWVTTDANGSFTVTLPTAGRTSGTYYVGVTDTHYLTISAAIVVQ